MRSRRKYSESSSPEQSKLPQAQQQEVQQRDDVRAALMRDLEAARFAADRAFRQYDATDPQNRLVAAELELRWNRTLERVTNLQERIDVHDFSRPKPCVWRPPFGGNLFCFIARRVQRDL